MSQFNTNKDKDGYPLIRTGAFSDSEGFRARFKGYEAVATKNTTTPLDFLVSEDRYISGVHLIMCDHVFGDSVDFQVVDKDGVGVALGWYDQATFDFLGEYVADTFGENWYAESDKQKQEPVIVPYLAKIYAGLYIRVNYHSVGTVDDVKLKANMRLHKKVI